MSDAQNKIKSLYQEIKENEKKKKAINAVVKEAFEKTKEYQDLMEEMKTLRARKKEVEIAIRSEYTTEFNELDDLKIDIKDTRHSVPGILPDNYLCVGITFVPAVKLKVFAVPFVMLI